MLQGGLNRFHQACLRYQQRIAVALTLIAALLAVTPSSAWAQGDEYWPFKRNPQSVWARVMSPQAGTAMFAINNRPVLYAEHGSSVEESPLEKAFNGDILKIADFNYERVENSPRLADLFLRRALSIARQHSAVYPWDVVECLVNLGALHYMLGESTTSAMYFHEAVTLARSVRGDEHLDVATIQDYLAIACRGTREFDRAESLYKSSLQIRQALLGNDHPDVAASYMNLAMLYNDAGCGDEATALRRVHEIMGDRAFISSILSAGPRPISTSLSCRPGYRSELPQMVAIANEIILKHPPKPLAPPRPPEPGLVAIVGTWNVPTDELPIHRTRERCYRDDTLQGEESVTERKSEENVSPVEGVPIYLCRAADARCIEGQIGLYARQHGLEAGEYCKAWPSVRRQATAITRMMNGVAQSRRIDVVRTDKLGEYQISDVPKGTYVLYASLETERQVLYWVSPTIVVTKKGVVTFDFDHSSATAVLWTRADTPQQVSRR